MEKVFDELSCGCIIIKDGKVLLIKQHNGDWGFPKGHMEEGESKKDTALRETKEETNIDVVIKNENTYVQEYITDRGKSKQVTYFVAEPKTEDHKPQEAEISEIKWLNFNEALNTITYEDTQNILKRVINDNK